ncbi:IS30 family transposase [Burkholderia sp. PAMC 26561]|uniref:IS30 family transposase n=1 Tax=Burkholderia sp. PAMC 26561 TaxID=1795043 RepID=UPI00076B8216|nr:IS30 family transposase [Burkholderia sp. PAMC 26561]AME28299.1 transcriptional regulator [Burkholderia sp. PAMC 26561]AMH43796.1 transcriptional regulator [Burkholderia sp. PAMC 26561]
MHKANQYEQLQAEERLEIASLRQRGSSIRAMARILGRSASTLSRELRRNSSVLGYVPAAAHALSLARRSNSAGAPKLGPHSACWRVVLTLLEWRWSPQQISGVLKRMFPNDPTLQVSHETIYTTIYAHPGGELRRQLIACLRRAHRARMSRTRGSDRRWQIPNMVSIHVRPPEIEDRVMPGHWEGDFIKGEGNRSSVGVLVERTSRLVLLAKMDDATAESALAGFSAKLNSIPEHLRHSFTYDQGRELSRHQELAAQTGVNVYFCDPHSPWQRGTCENTNGLLREYLPKGTDLSVHSQADLDVIADSLNNRPRATHAFHSPFEVFAATLKAADLATSSKH